MKIDKRILLIDDEEVIAFGFTKVFTEPGVCVDWASSIEETAKLTAANQYVAAIVDLRLSNSIEIEGFTCIKHLQATQRDCKIVILSAYRNAAFKTQAKELGVLLFFEKPMEPSVIKDTLRTFGVYDS